LTTRKCWLLGGKIPFQPFCKIKKVFFSFFVLPWLALRNWERLHAKGPNIWGMGGMVFGALQAAVLHAFPISVTPFYIKVTP
jgi:hypothetical protein